MQFFEAQKPPEASGDTTSNKPENIWQKIVHSPYFWPLLALVIAIVVHFRWFIDLSILTEGDWRQFYWERQREFLQLPYLWNSSGVGSVDIGLSMYPTYLLYGIFSFIGEYGLSERLIYLWPTVICGALGSYFLVRKVSDSYIGGFIGSIVYSFNTYFLLGKTGHLTLMASFAVAPIVLLCFMRALEKRSAKYAVLAGLTGFWCSFYEFRAFYILAWILFLYMIYYILFIKRPFNIRNIIRSLWLSALPIIIILLLNFYWLWGFKNLEVLLNNEFFDRALFGSQYMSILRALTLFHPFWNGAEPVPFQMSAIPLPFYLIPILAILGLVCNRKNRELVFFGIVALVGIILTKQSSPPFPELYQWLFKNIPGFNAFREASKFYFVIALSYSVLIGGFIAWLWKQEWKTKLQEYGSYLATLGTLVLFLYSTQSLLTGEINTLFVGKERPPEYLQVKDYILEQEGFFRTLWIPVKSTWAISTDKRPGLDLPRMLGSTWDEIKGKTEGDKYLNDQEKRVRIFTRPFANNLLDQSVIRYVIVARQGDGFYKATLTRMPYLVEIDLGLQELAVFENKNYRPHVYSSWQEESLDRQIAFQDIEWESVSTTEYTAQLKNISGPTYVHLAEEFHPSWKARIGPLEWYKSIFDPNYFLPDFQHIQSPANLNTFLIDPSFIKKNFPLNSYRSNADGSMDLTVTLYFKPQSYVYAGSIVSGITLIMSLGFVSGRREDDDEPLTA